MKRLCNNERTIYGLKRRFFTIIKSNESDKLYYYINLIWSKNDGDFLIYKSKKKSKIFNKYIMSFLGILSSFFFILIIPLIIIYMYFTGLYNFINDSAWDNENVKFFNWSNFIIMLTLLSILIFN